MLWRPVGRRGVDGGWAVRLFLMEYFILLFLRILCHLKCFKIVNETTAKIHDFILEFRTTKLYVVPLVVYRMK
jgi:hypothetical protein